jgi:7,8-dihydropterin-6-yl-methyl-4-(beta-D-ribofuranosyl)aminobenzene 5'-phosphate synthase
MTEVNPVDRVRLVTLADNAVDNTAPNVGPVRRQAIGEDLTPASAMVGGEVHRPLVAEHGFSTLLEVTVGNRTRRLLFDTGPSPAGMVANAAGLGVDLTGISGVVLSHGHYDHTTGMSGLAGLALEPATPVLVHPDAWVPRRVRSAGGRVREMPVPSRSAIEAAGFRVVEATGPSMLFDDSAVITGAIPRRTPFEVGFPGHEAFRDGEWVPDPEIPDDQAFATVVRGAGVVVVTGCGHSGIVNVVEAARRLTGTAQVLAVIGGFHLHGSAFAPRIPDTVAALAAIEPRYLIPSHCTGYPAMRALADVFGDRMIPNLVGSSITFEA